MQDFSEYHKVCEEERELPGAYQDQRMHGEYPERDAYSGIRMRGEYPEVPSKPSAYNCSDHISGRGEDYRQAWECQKDQHGCRKASDPVPSSRSSTRVKQSHLMLDEQMKGIDSLSKVIDDQLRPCCSHTGKHLCTSLEDLADACSKEELKMQQMHSKVCILSQACLLLCKAVSSVDMNVFNFFQCCICVPTFLVSSFLFHISILFIYILIFLFPKGIKARS